MNVDIIHAGCAGSKISVSPRTEQDRRVPADEAHGIRCWVLPELAEKLDGAQIAHAKGRYYLVSKKIQARCGCGASFSFEKKTVSQDLAKIHRLQNALKMSPELSRIQRALQGALKK